MKTLITGGLGYIGSHTAIDMIGNNCEIVLLDNEINSYANTKERIEEITNTKVKYYKIDACNLMDLNKLFVNEKINSIIHFAALKSVPKSVINPVLYYQNNIQSLLNLLEMVQKYNIQHFVFSSSCSVYGNTNALPVVETTPFAIAESPYAHTKQIGEEIIQNVVKASKCNFILLRYFNPVGAHPSGLNGENPKDGEVNNLVPRITGTAVGKYSQLQVFGNNYPTRDGTCIRDYIHVMDIANAHTKALQYLWKQKSENYCEVFNLGTGYGVSVLELINAFEKVTNQKLNYVLSPRRQGDVVQVFANNNKAKSVLGWQPQYSINEMMQSAWQWQQKMINEELR